MGYSEYELPRRQWNSATGLPAEDTYNYVQNAGPAAPKNNTGTDEACPYCKKPHHTREQCWLRKSDEDLKDKVKTLLPSLKKIYKAQEEILQQGGLKPHQGK